MWKLNINMSSKNIKGPYECMGLKEYKLSNFCNRFFFWIPSTDDLSRFAYENIGDNIYSFGKKR